MALAAEDVDHVVARLKGGASPEAVKHELVARGVGADEAHAKVAELVRLKVHAEVRAAISDMIRKGYLWAPLEAAVRKRDLTTEDADAILQEARPAFELAEEDRNRRELADASAQRDLLMFTRLSDRRRTTTFYGTIGLGVLMIAGAIGISLLSVGGFRILPIGLASFGSAAIARAFAQRYKR